MKKVYVFCLCCLVMLLMACGKENKDSAATEEPGNNEIYIYYLGLNQTDLYPVLFRLKAKDDVVATAESIMEQLENVDEGEQYFSPIPKGISYQSCNLGQRQNNMELWFDVDYESVNSEKLLFLKACVSNSLLNVEGIDTVTMYFTDLVNMDEETATISESFDSDSFNLSFDNEDGYTQKGTITVYFANEEGTILKEYRKIVEISNTTSLPRLVVETLIDGPKQEGYIATLPADTKVSKISVKDGICYVDLSEEFYDAENPLQNDIIVYSVVNSLVELPNVSKVQFLKEGEKVPVFRGTFAFDGIFERNLDLTEMRVTTENTEDEISEEISEEETSLLNN